MDKKIIEGGYQILDTGIVLNKKGSVLKLHKGTCGYIQLNVFKKGKYKTHLVHRLVAQMFIPNPENFAEVNHKDGDKCNNSVSNLEWCSRSFNIRHALSTGLINPPWTGKTGILHHRSKSVTQINKDTNETVCVFGSAREAAKLSGINYGTISNVLIGKRKTAGGFIWKY